MAEQRRYPTRGFGSMDPARVREIARSGGIAAQEQGVAHQWTEDEARAAARKSAQVRRAARLARKAR